MTAGAKENQAASAAVAAAEAFSASVVAQELREAASTTGSAMSTGMANVEPPSVAWPSPSSAGQPPAVSPQPSSSPNVIDPRDNRQSQ